MFDEFSAQEPQTVVDWFGFGITFDGEMARENADDVAVEDGFGLCESDAGDGAGGVASDAGEGEDIIEAAWEGGGMFFADEASGFLEIARAGVVTETFPEFEDVLFVGDGERGDGGEVLHPAFPIWNDGFDLGLLEHNLRNPDGVRIVGPTPREVAGVFREPGRDGVGELACQLFQIRS